MASAMPASVKKPDAAPVTISFLLFTSISGSVKLPLTAIPAPVQPVGIVEAVVPFQPERSILSAVTPVTVYFTSVPATPTVPVAVALNFRPLASVCSMATVPLPVPGCVMLAAGKEAIPVAPLTSVLLSFTCSGVVDFPVNVKSAASTVAVVPKVNPESARGVSHAMSPREILEAKPVSTVYSTFL